MADGVNSGKVMTMILRRAGVFVLCLVVVLQVWSQDQPGTQALDDTDYQLISMGLSETVVQPRLAEKESRIQQVVIIPQASLRIPPGAMGMTRMNDDEAKKIREEVPDLVKALFELNKVTAAVDVAKLTTPLKATAISEEQLKEIFEAKGDSWQEFYKKFPKSQGVSIVSRVAYNAAKTQALLYIGTMNASLAGLGEIVLFEKNGSTWKLRRHGMVWVS